MDELKICMGGNDEMRKVMKEHSGMLDMFYLNWRWLHKFIWIKMSVLYSIKIKIMKTRKEIIQLNKTAFKITLPTAALLLMEFIILFIYFFTLQYCLGFAIHCLWNLNISYPKGKSL